MHPDLIFLTDRQSPSAKAHFRELAQQIAEGSGPSLKELFEAVAESRDSIKVASDILYLVSRGLKVLPDNLEEKKLKKTYGIDLEVLAFFLDSKDNYLVSMSTFCLELLCEKGISIEPYIPKIEHSLFYSVDSITLHSLNALFTYGTKADYAYDGINLFCEALRSNNERIRLAGLRGFWQLIRWREDNADLKRWRYLMEYLIDCLVDEVKEVRELAHDVALSFLAHYPEKAADGLRHFERKAMDTNEPLSREVYEACKKAAKTI
ncbi:hypothetical protein CO046_01620 [Candidatus Peregrinibacteria bacterium CG_4_9_14_0_2_um_filter_53_11]|nr:MAG: hypothetical protein CO046_01620 [Candidatus Peregrinibacteria bacterium CG_4_9_14_0_2_um_filter_53_11]